MPRQIRPTISFDEAENEVFFTRASLKADPDAKALLPLTDTWLAMIDTARAKDRAAREAVSDADAARVIANDRLDGACTRFGDDLFLAVGKDRTAIRWVQFFAGSVSRFVRQSLVAQVNKVYGWLRSTDPVLERHRESLATWNHAAAAALEQTAALAPIRGESALAREQMAEDLTRERDGLHDALSQLAREKNLPRDWPDLFFHKSPVRRASRANTDTPETPAQS